MSYKSELRATCWIRMLILENIGWYLTFLFDLLEGQGDGQGQEQGDDDHVYIDAMLI